MKHTLETLLMMALMILPISLRAEGLPPTPTVAEPQLEELLSPEELEAEMAADPEAIIDNSPLASFAPNVYVVVDKSEQRLTVWENGRAVGSWAVSTGTETRKCAPTGRCYRAHTPTGSFRPFRMHHRYTSRLWQARMDRAIFIVGGIALHATYGENVSKLGTRQSGGCIRQAPGNADRLFRLVKKYGMGNTLVKVQE